MCDLVSALTLAVSVASTAVGYEQQSEAYNANVEASNDAAKVQYFQTQQQMIQQQEAAAVDKMDVAKQGRAAAATAEVNAGEAGISGLSVDGLLREFAGKTANYNDRTDQQTEWSMAQLNNQMKGIKAQAQSRINSVQAPSFLDAGLRIAGAGLDSVSSHYQRAATAQQNGRELSWLGW